MSTRQTLRQALVEQRFTFDSLPNPEISPDTEPPPTGNEPEDDEEFDPKGIIAPRGASGVSIEYIPPRDQLPHGTEQQLSAFEDLRADLDFPREVTRHTASDAALVAALAQRWGDEHDPYEILRFVGEHDPAGYSSIDFIHLMFNLMDRILLRDRDDGILWLHEIRTDNLGVMKHSHDVRFQINPWYPDTRKVSPLATGFRHMLLRFSTLPEDTALRILIQIPCWVRAIYRRPGFPVEALLEIDARTAAEFHACMIHLGPHLAAVGADPECMKSTAFSRLPVARRNGIIEDILYMDTRPIPVQARPIATCSP